MSRLRRTAAAVAAATALAGCALISGAGDLSVGPLEDGDGDGGALEGSVVALDGATTSDAPGGTDGSVGPTDGAAGDAKKPGDGGDAGGRLREVTFEDGSLLGVHGGDSMVGTPFLATGLTALAGNDSMKIDKNTSGIEVDFAPVGELYATALVRVENLSVGVSTGLEFIPELGGSTAQIQVEAGGGASTPVLLAVGGTVVDSGGVVAQNTIYRLGFHLRHDATTSLVEIFVAASGAAFGQPVISTTIATLGRTKAVRMGVLDNGGTNTRAIFDNLLLDTLAMP
jgi:hypothetical protein